MHTRPSSARCPYSAGGAHWFLGYRAVLVARYSLKSTGSEGSGYSQGNQGELYITQHPCARGCSAHLHPDANVITGCAIWSGYQDTFVVLMGRPFVSCRRGVCICMLFTVRTSPNRNTSSPSILRPSLRWVLLSQYSTFLIALIDLLPALWKPAHSPESPESVSGWWPWTFEGDPNNKFNSRLARTCVYGYVFPSLGWKCPTSLGFCLLNGAV